MEGLLPAAVQNGVYSTGSDVRLGKELTAATDAHAVVPLARVPAMSCCDRCGFRAEAEEPTTSVVLG